MDPPKANRGEFLFAKRRPATMRATKEGAASHARRPLGNSRAFELDGDVARLGYLHLG